MVNCEEHTQILIQILIIQYTFTEISIWTFNKLISPILYLIVSGGS
eukprot:SAG11_NODE_27416_length_333_cov_0.542735_1_plen_45_part_10